MILFKGGYRMNAQKLSKRLETVASFVPKGAVLADIGSDHAYLPCYLVLEKTIDKAIAGEVVKGPFETAKAHVKELNLENQIDVRLADGLEAIKQEDDVDTVTIAGMGGPLIVSILEKNPEKLKTVKRLILQPNIHAKVIREWAMKNGWTILDEVILEEDSKIYEILVLERGELSLTEAEVLLGKHLIKKNTTVFQKKWQMELENWERILNSLEKAEQTIEIIQKKKEIEQKMKLVKEVLK